MIRPIDLHRALGLIAARFLVLGLLAGFPPRQVEAQVPGVEHVVVIGVDGLSPEGIKRAKTPVLHKMMAEGASTLHARGVMPTVSSPNWASMIMGAGPEQHGVTSNDWKPGKGGDHAHGGRFERDLPDDLRPAPRAEARRARSAASTTGTTSPASSSPGSATSRSTPRGRSRRPIRRSSSSRRSGRPSSSSTSITSTTRGTNPATARPNTTRRSRRPTG